MARSDSATASPQVGSAGQAIENRRAADSSGGRVTPCAWRMRSTVSMPSASRSVSSRFCCAVSRMPGRSRVTISCSAVLSRWPAGVHDPAALDEHAVEPAAVALPVPAEVVVERQRGQRHRRAER